MLAGDTAGMGVWCPGATMMLPPKSSSESEFSCSGRSPRLKGDGDAPRWEGSRDDVAIALNLAKGLVWMLCGRPVSEAGGEEGGDAPQPEREMDV